MDEYDLSGLNVLIIDDYQPMRVIMRNVLYALGIKEISDAASGPDRRRRPLDIDGEERRDDNYDYDEHKRTLNR